MAWVQVAVAEKNGSTFAKTLLLNTKKFGEIKANGTVAEFYYEEDSDATHNFKTSALTKDQLVTLVTTDDLFDNRIELPILAVSKVKKNKTNSSDNLSSTTVYNVEADTLVWAWDIGTSATTCYGFFRVGKSSILYRINDTIANLESASSTSVSII